MSFWTAYLKANYPAEYMAALLTSVRDDKDKSALYLAECRRMGIKVLPPDVNDSDGDFTPRGTDIRFGLEAIRNVGANVVASIVRTREQKGRYADFPDFLRKVEALACNKKTVESLVKAGAFDSLGHTRKGLQAIHAEAIEVCMDTKRREAEGQFDLFGGMGDEAGDDGGVFDVRIPVGEWDKALLLAHEREMLGLYVSDHPLLGVEHIIAGAVDCPVSAVADRDDGAQVIDRRHPVQRRPQGHQEGRPLGAGDAGGPRGRGRGDVLPGQLPGGGGAARRGRRRARPRPGRQARGRAEDHRQRGRGPRPVDRPARAGRGVPADRALHAAGGRAVQGGAGRAPGHHRGAPAAGQRRPDDRGAARRPAAGQRGRRPCSPTSRPCSARAACR